MVKTIFDLIFLGDNTQDMDISPGDSTPTSEASYGHLGTPSIRHCGTPANDGNSLCRKSYRFLLYILIIFFFLGANQQSSMMTTVLPRLSSHPTTPCSTSSASRSLCKTSPNSSNMGPTIITGANAGTQMNSVPGPPNKMLLQSNGIFLLYLIYIFDNSIGRNGNILFETTFMSGI